MKSAQIADDLDNEGDGKGYSGTFRWKRSKVLVSMPHMDGNNKVDVAEGWMQYLASRCRSKQKLDRLVQSIQDDLSTIDCLSSPISIAHMSHVVGLDPKAGNITFVCIGCSGKAEQRILMETNCWEELCSYFSPDAPQVCLHLVGPEMSSTEIVVDKRFEARSCHFIASTFRGTASQFFRANPILMTQNTVVVGLNCGFGNFENSLPSSSRFNLLLSWLPDLYFLTATKMPCFFTCANDYADLTGEVTLMRHLLGASFLSAPSSNPFGFASTFVADASKKEGSTYSRGNSFWYAVQGHDKKRRVKLDLAQAQAQAQAGAKIRSEIAKALLAGQGQRVFDDIPMTTIKFPLSSPQVLQSNPSLQPSPSTQQEAERQASPISNKQNNTSRSNSYTNPGSQQPPTGLEQAAGAASPIPIRENVAVGGVGEGQEILLIEPETAEERGGGGGRDEVEEIQAQLRHLAVAATRGEDAVALARQRAQQRTREMEEVEEAVARSAEHLCGSLEAVEQEGVITPPRSDATTAMLAQEVVGKLSVCLTVEQSLKEEDDKKILVVSMPLDGLAVTSMASLELEAAPGGHKLRLTVPCPAGEAEKEVRQIEVDLLCAIHVATMSAKFSKKTNRLTIRAQPRGTD